ADPIGRGDRFGGSPESAFDREVFDQVGDPQQRLAHSTHATLWRGATSRSGGIAWVQTGIAKRQRGAKRQPGGSSARLGTVPGIASRRVLTPALSTRGIERMSPCV